MEVVIVCRANVWRLRYKFACSSGGANERKPHKLALAQRQRKQKNSVLTKESADILRHRKNKTMPVPF